MSFGIIDAWAGETLLPGAGNGLSGVLVLIVSQPVPVFFGNMNGPLKVAPASSRIVSPSCAISIASWRSPPSPMRIVRPGDGTNVVSTYSRGASGAAVSGRATDGAPAHPKAGVSNGTSSMATATNAYIVDSLSGRSFRVFTTRSLDTRHPTAWSRGLVPNR